MLAFLLGMFVLLQCGVRLSTTIQIGADEGFELAKATLCLKGYRLYMDVWNDQPPLHTFIITEVLKHISPSILGPRLVTSALTMLLLSSVFFMSLRVSGLLVAALTAALLIMSPGFLELASSCMLEIPALGLAVAALWLLLRGRQSTFVERAPAGARSSSSAASPDCQAARDSLCTAEVSDIAAPGDRRTPRSNWHARELLAGAVFGAALMSKLVDIYLLPLAAVVLWSRLREGSTNGSAGWQPAVSRIVNPQGLASHLTAERLPVANRRYSRLPIGATSAPLLPVKAIARHLIIFIASCGVTCLAIDFLIEHGAYLAHFRQSWASHFGPTKTLAYGSASDHPFDWGIVLRNWDVTIPAAVGVSVFLSRFRRHRALPLPLAWLALSSIVFTIHRPWWAYYYIHTAIPLCWCAAAGFAWAIERAWAWAPTQGRDWRAAPSPSPSVASGDGNRTWIADTSEQSFRPLERGRGHRSAMSLPLEAISTRGRRSVALIAVVTFFGIGAACWSVARVYLQVREIRNSPQTYYALVLKEIERLKPWTDWIYADQQIYSFHTGIPIPPDLAVLVLKRFWAGEMDNDRITQELRQFKPGVILLANDARAVPFKDLLNDEYQVIYQDGNHRLYGLKSMLKARKTALSHARPE